MSPWIDLDLLHGKNQAASFLQRQDALPFPAVLASSAYKFGAATKLAFSLKDPSVVGVPSTLCDLSIR